MPQKIKRSVVRMALGVLVFAAVLGGWAYLQSYNDQKLLKEFASQKMGLDTNGAGAPNGIFRQDIFVSRNDAHATTSTPKRHILGQSVA